MNSNDCRVKANLHVNDGNELFSEETGLYYYIFGYSIFKEMILREEQLSKSRLVGLCCFSVASQMTWKDRNDSNGMEIM